MNRKQIGKRLRFQIFSRDNFTCRYCGRQADSVPLHIDHIIPVCQDGTNDPENLATSCADCNLGKAGKTIKQSAPNEHDRLRMAQEMNEQMQALETAKKSMKARKERKDMLLDFWQETTGREEYSVPTLNVIFSYVLEYGEDIVFPWIEKAEAKCRNDNAMGRYISGIRRIVKAESEGDE